MDNTDDRGKRRLPPPPPGSTKTEGPVTTDPDNELPHLLEVVLDAAEQGDPRLHRLFTQFHDAACTVHGADPAKVHDDGRMLRQQGLNFDTQFPRNKRFTVGDRPNVRRYATRLLGMLRGPNDLASVLEGIGAAVRRLEEYSEEPGLSSIPDRHTSSGRDSGRGGR